MGDEIEVTTKTTHKEKTSGKVRHPGSSYRTDPRTAKLRRRLGLVRYAENAKSRLRPPEDKSLSGPPENKEVVPQLQDKSRGDLVDLAKEAGVLESIEGTGANGYVKKEDLRKALQGS